MEYLLLMVINIINLLCVHIIYYLAVNRDCFTDSEVFHLTRLFDTCPYFSTDKSGTIVVLQPKVDFKTYRIIIKLFILKITMKRHIGDRTEQFVEWTPEDM